MSGTQSFLQGQALNLFNGDLSSLAFTPEQPRSVLRHTGSCTHPSPSHCNSHHLGSDTSQFLSASLSLQVTECRLFAMAGSLPPISLILFTKWPGKLSCLFHLLQTEIGSSKSKVTWTRFLHWEAVKPGFEPSLWEQGQWLRSVHLPVSSSPDFNLVIKNRS